MPDTIERVVTPAYPKEITTAIAKIMGADLYVQKRGKNQFHGYKFASMGDLLDKLQPLIAEAGLVLIQHELGAEFIDGGNVMATRYQFTLAHTSGAVWPDRPTLTGMAVCRNSKGGFDDKAANKCHTAARKYFLLGLFQVPTGEDFREKVHVEDADGHDHAPPPTEDPFTPPAEEPEPWRTAARAIAKAIDASPHLVGLNNLMEQKGVDPKSKDPRTGSDLEFIRGQNAESYAFLLDRAQKKRGMFLNEPGKAA